MFFLKKKKNVILSLFVCLLYVVVFLFSLLWLLLFLLLLLLWLLLGSDKQSDKLEINVCLDVWCCVFLKTMKSLSVLNGSNLWT